MDATILEDLAPILIMGFGAYIVYSIYLRFTG